MKLKIFLFLIMMMVIVSGIALFVFSDFLKNNQKIKIDNNYLLLKTDEFENYNLMRNEGGGYSLTIPDICAVYQFNRKIMIFSKPGSFISSTYNSSNGKEQLNLYYILNNDSIIQISEKDALYNKKQFKLKFISPFCK